VASEARIVREKAEKTAAAEAKQRKHWEKLAMKNIMKVEKRAAREAKREAEEGARVKKVDEDGPKMNLQQGVDAQEVSASIQEEEKEEVYKEEQNDDDDDGGADPQ
jgi:hypothetical protein